MSMDSGRIGGYAAAMSQSLYEQGKAVGRQIVASTEIVAKKRSAITDVALQQIQRSTAAKNDMLTVGSKLNIYA